MVVLRQRWLLERNRDEEARAVVHRLHGGKYEAVKARAEEEFAIMHVAIKAEMMTRSRSIRDLWTTPAMLKRTLIACGVQIFGQCTGVNGMRLALQVLSGHDDIHVGFCDSDQILRAEDVRDSRSQLR